MIVDRDPANVPQRLEADPAADMGCVDAARPAETDAPVNDTVRDRPAHVPTLTTLEGDRFGERHDEHFKCGSDTSARPAQKAAPRDRLWRSRLRGRLRDGP